MLEGERTNLLIVWAAEHLDEALCLGYICIKAQCAISMVSTNPNENWRLVRVFRSNLLRSVYVKVEVGKGRDSCCSAAFSAINSLYAVKVGGIT